MQAPFKTPLGTGTVVVEDGRLVEVLLPRQEESGAPPSAPPVRSRSESTGADAETAIRWTRDLEAYFRGERRGWTDTEVGLEGYGFTPFRTAVYRALLAVPAGETISYGELARRAGRPGAARAVGSAMAENPIAVVVPCHRVVRGDGSLGDYGFGLPWKRFLLQAEGALEGGGPRPAARNGGDLADSASPQSESRTGAAGPTADGDPLR